MRVAALAYLGAIRPSLSLGHHVDMTSQIGSIGNWVGYGVTWIDQDGMQEAVPTPLGVRKLPPPSHHVDLTAQIVSIGRWRGCEGHRLIRLGCRSPSSSRCNETAFSRSSRSPDCSNRVHWKLGRLRSDLDRSRWDTGSSSKVFRCKETDCLLQVIGASALPVVFVVWRRSC